MKNMVNTKRGKIFLFLAMAILVMSPFVFAGFGEWWTKFTGRATSWPTGVSIVVGNTAPVVTFVNVSTPASGSGTDPVEAVGRVIGIVFNASDADGIANLVNASAKVFVNISGDFYYYSTCTPLGGASESNTTMMRYNCTVTLPYYAVPGTYSVNASIADINGARTDRWTTWDLGTLNAITINNSNITFPALSAVSTNTPSNNNPIGINNTGNRQVNINVTGIDLPGWVNPTKFIGAANFSVAGSSTGCAGTALANDTAINITSAYLFRGSNMTKGAANLNFCITDINDDLPADSYNATRTRTGTWYVLAEPGNQI
jgi:hypothetical protein